MRAENGIPGMMPQDHRGMIEIILAVIAGWRSICRRIAMGHDMCSPSPATTPMRRSEEPPHPAHTHMEGCTSALHPTPHTPVGILTSSDHLLLRLIPSHSSTSCASRRMPGCFLHALCRNGGRRRQGSSVQNPRCSRWAVRLAPGQTDVA